ncbi:MAG: N-acylglucosamine 2-epimerase [Saprospiraceae bacterium]|nr:N-acylglucosamine 2-epimerase [Saprospiraceae bacterium]
MWYTNILLSLAWAFCTHTSAPIDAVSVSLDRQAIAKQMEEWLNTGCLDNWYPRCIDAEAGGFYSDFDEEWNLSGKQNKMIVTQARHVWSLSVAAEFYPDRDYLSMAKHGFEFLRDHMWDAEVGGFFQTVDRNGAAIAGDDASDIIKTAYGNAFGIYGCSAYYRASGNEQSLDLAKKAFAWLEEHSHDPQLLGYFQFLKRDGTARKAGHTAPPKDQNSSIHLLEALTELYHVWPDPLVKERLDEMLVLIRDTITGDKSYLTLFSQADWTPVEYRDSALEVRQAHYNLDHVSFGHDIETAYLLMEASHVSHHAEDEKTKMVAKQMVDHTLKNGWDKESGGIYDAGYYEVVGGPMKIIHHTKAWWAQLEAMNTMLIMADMYPDDEIKYEDFFVKQVQHIDQYLVDKTNGGFYIHSIDESPKAIQVHKGSIWKGNYHNLRSLVNCIKRLRNDH